MEEKALCQICDNLEKDDSLYICRYDDVGYCFDEIRNIQYCPKCGRRLSTYEEKAERVRESFTRMAKKMLKEMGE